MFGELLRKFLTIKCFVNSPRTSTQSLENLLGYEIVFVTLKLLHKQATVCTLSYTIPARAVFITDTRI